jgi:hypothetical protein
VRSTIRAREAVVHHALGLLDGELSSDTVAALGRLREHADPELRAAALAASTRAGFDRQLLEHALDDHDPHVRAAALVGLASHDVATPSVTEAIAALAAGSTLDRLALVNAIRFAPSARFRHVLYEVLAHGELSVMQEVLHVLAYNPEFVELDRLLDFLENPDLRADTRRVFVSVGRPGLDRLIAALDDPQTPPSLRRHLPRTISRFSSEAAAAALVARLAHESDGSSEFKLLRALGRMRADNPRLVIAPAPVRDYVRRAVTEAARYTAFADELVVLGMHTRFAGTCGSWNRPASPGSPRSVSRSSG